MTATRTEKKPAGKMSDGTPFINLSTKIPITRQRIIDVIFMRVASRNSFERLSAIPKARHTAIQYVREAIEKPAMNANPVDIALAFEDGTQEQWLFTIGQQVNAMFPELVVIPKPSKK